MPRLNRPPRPAPARPLRVLPSALALLVLLGGAPARTQAREAPVKVRVGDRPPDYLGRDFQNRPVTVGQFRGKVVIVTFWASWCGPCRKEIPILESVQGIAGPDALAVVAVNFNEDDDTWDAMRRKLSGLALRITHDPDEKVPASFGVDTLPHMFMLDRDGRVAVVRVGYSEERLDGFVDDLNRLLAAPPSPPVSASVPPPGATPAPPSSPAGPA